MGRREREGRRTRDEEKKTETANPIEEAKKGFFGPLGRGWRK